jgi:hypothetical protein
MPPKLTLLSITALAILACCLSGATASAGELVPPGNSAVNQYTETFPTSEGEEQSSLEKKKGVTPGQVLGAGKAHKLEDKGAAGKAVAEFTAETAPSSASESGNGESSGGQTGKGKANGKGKAPHKQGGNGPGGGGGGEEQQSAGGPGGGSAGNGSGGGSGSSGLGEIVSQATGTSSGSIGLWLPLILIAVVIWSAVYVWRNRQQRVV